MFLVSLKKIDKNPGPASPYSMIDKITSPCHKQDSPRVRSYERFLSKNRSKGRSWAVANSIWAIWANWAFELCLLTFFTDQWPHVLFIEYDAKALYLESGLTLLEALTFRTVRSRQDPTGPSPPIKHKYSSMEFEELEVVEP